MVETEDQKALIRRLYEGAINGSDMGIVDEAFAPESVAHGLLSTLPPGMEGAKQFVAAWRAAFPDAHTTIEDLVVDGDRAAVRWRTIGTHRGELLGIAPTGRHVDVAGIDVMRFAGGKIVEHWNGTDTLGLLRQLGAVEV